MMPDEHTPRIRWGWLLLGLFFIIAFYSLNATVVGIKMQYAIPWNRSTASELYFVCGILMFVFPGLLFAFTGVADFIPRLSQAAWKRLNAVSKKEIGTGLFVVFTFGLLTAVLGNLFVLHGFPITDDEHAARYGGQLLAQGKTSEPAPSYFDAIPHKYFYLREGMMSSFEYLGAQLPWAFAELTGTENLVFSLFAALAAVGVAGVVGLQLSPAWGAVAALLFLASPMAASLSITTHTHVISRGCIAAVLLMLLLARKSTSRGMWIVAGLLVGGALVTRPLHAAALLGPLLVYYLWDSFKPEKSYRQGMVLLLISAGFWIVLMAVHSYLHTGTIVPARFASNELPRHPELQALMHPPLAFLTDLSIFWTRFGGNLNYNLFMLCIWGLGPATLPLVVLGAGKDAFSKALCLGIVLHFGVALLHEIPGIHNVGPIHYSETIVPVIILASFGLFRLKTMLRYVGCPVVMPMAMIFLVTISGCLFLMHGNLDGLNRQADAHKYIYEILDKPEYDHSVVLVPPYYTVWQAHEEFRTTGNMVFEWRKNEPGHTGRVILLHEPEQEMFQVAKAAFPDRKFFHLQVNQGDPLIKMVRVK